MKGTKKIEENREPVNELPKNKLVRFINNRGEALGVYELSVQAGPK